MNSSQMFVSRGRRHGAQSRACNGHAFTILNNTKSNTINTNQYTIQYMQVAIECYRVSTVWPF